MNVQDFQPHEKRVFDELTDLLDKSKKLDAFIYENSLFKGLMPSEQELLKKQSKIMHAYAGVLCERIACFSNNING